MRVIYLLANQCYAVLLGDSMISVGHHAQTLFPTKRELRQALKDCGLKIGARGFIQSAQHNKEEI
jgi:hypothetical protein